MNNQQRLKLSEVREVFQVIGHARELRHDPEQQEKVIVDNMVRLLDADYGHAIRFGNFRPQAPTYVKRLSYGSIKDPTVCSYLSEWGKTHSIDEDPLKPVTWNKAGPVHTTSRSREMTFEKWRTYAIYEQVVEPASINDALMTFFRYPNADDTRGYTFVRTLDKKEFTQRQRRLAHLFSKELFNLYHQGLLEEKSPLDELPDRLAVMAKDLMTGLTQKQIAEARSLSYHTVRSYTKDLYDRLGVHSRQALIEHLSRRN